MPDILILGASSDIAAACAKKYATEKYNIWLAGRNIQLLNTQAQDLKLRYNVQVNVLPFDANNFQSHPDFVKSLSFVPDLVIAAFGYLGDQAVAENDWDECNLIINSNYTGAVSILNILSNLMIEHKKGVIAGISSVAGLRGKKSNYMYGSAKAGFTTYLSGLRNRLYQFNVHVITVLPGFVDTKMTQSMKLPKALTAQPEKVALDIFNGVKNKKNTIYTKSMWRYIMLIISNIPEFIYKKLNLG